MSGNFAMINGIVCYKKRFESQKNWLTQRKKDTHFPHFCDMRKKNPRIYGIKQRGFLDKKEKN